MQTNALFPFLFHCSTMEQEWKKQLEQLQLRFQGKTAVKTAVDQHMLPRISLYAASLFRGLRNVSCDMHSYNCIQ